MSDNVTKDREAGKHTPRIELPDTIWAWAFIAERQDDVIQGGWTQHVDRREQAYVKRTPERAAAPDMLESLRACEAAMCEASNMHNRSAQVLSEHIHAARAAIARATGDAQ